MGQLGRGGMPWYETGAIGSRTGRAAVRQGGQRHLWGIERNWFCMYIRQELVPGSRNCHEYATVLQGMLCISSLLPAQTHEMQSKPAGRYSVAAATWFEVDQLHYKDCTTAGHP